MEAERGKESDSEKPSLPKQRKTKFWVARPFTRLIAWGKDYNYVVRYMAKNHDQASKRKQNVFAAWGFDVTEPDQVKLLNTGWGA